MEKKIGLLKKALVDGYSSVMVDASRYNLEGNIRMTREIVEFAKQFDASVEGEIGCMGASEGDNYTDDDMKTNPNEALRFAKELELMHWQFLLEVLMETIQKDMYQNLILRD